MKLLVRWSHFHWNPISIRRLKFLMLIVNETPKHFLTFRRNSLTPLARLKSNSFVAQVSQEFKFLFTHFFCSSLFFNLIHLTFERQMANCQIIHICSSLYRYHMFVIWSNTFSRRRAASNRGLKRRINAMQIVQEYTRVNYYPIAKKINFQQQILKVFIMIYLRILKL